MLLCINSETRSLNKTLSLQETQKKPDVFGRAPTELNGKYPITFPPTRYHHVVMFSAFQEISLRPGKLLLHSSLLLRFPECLLR